MLGAWLRCSWYLDVHMTQKGVQMAFVMTYILIYTYTHDNHNDAGSSGKIRRTGK